MFCFCLLEIINPEISFARIFLLSAVFCFTCFLSQSETQAIMLGLHPDPLLLGADQKTGRPGSLTYMVTQLSPTPKHIFLKRLPLQCLGTPLYNSVNNEHKPICYQPPIISFQFGSGTYIHNSSHVNRFRKKECSTIKLDLDLQENTSQGLATTRVQHLLEANNHNSI